MFVILLLNGLTDFNFFNTFIGFIFRPQSYLMLIGDKVVQDGGYVKPSRSIGSQMRLPEYTYRYKAADFKLEASKVGIR